MANEMAHYAADCWDAELLTSYGWVECVGCADRSAYDLSVHAKKTGAALIVRERLDQPIIVNEWVAELNRKKAGPHFKKDAKAVETAIEALSQEARESLAADLARDGKITVDTFELTPDLIVIEKRTRTENVRDYTPNVIEPSFGIGRILYSILEHNYWFRAGDTEARAVLSFPPQVAPTKVLLVPLSNHVDFKPAVRHLSHAMRALGISNRIDDSSASIGKRYSRNDELGTPLGITVDFQSLKDETYTLRDRDSTRQVRAKEAVVLDAVGRMCRGEWEWKDVERELPAFEGQDVESSLPVR